MPETSVIIPTYNRFPFLKDAVDSVFAQTYSDFELIVIDDGSNDGTAAFCHSLKSCIRYEYQKNRGPSAARNAGISIARGEFITFLDSDDLWEKRKLERQIHFMKDRPEARVCYTDEIWVRRGVRVNPKRKHRKYDGWIFQQSLGLCMVSPSSVLMRRSFFDVVGLFDESLPSCEDYDLWLRASLVMQFYFLDEKLIIKRGGRPDQLSAAWGLDRYRVQVLLKLLQMELSKRQRILVKNELVRKCHILEQGYKKRAKEFEAAYYCKLWQAHT